MHTVAPSDTRVPQPAVPRPPLGGAMTRQTYQGPCPLHPTIVLAAARVTFDVSPTSDYEGLISTGNHVALPSKGPHSVPTSMHVQEKYRHNNRKRRAGLKKKLLPATHQWSGHPPPE